MGNFHLSSPKNQFVGQNIEKCEEPTGLTFGSVPFS